MRTSILKASMVLFTCIFSISALWAQSPQSISYQSIVRDGSNNLVINHSVGMKISILQGSSTGTAVYSEIKTPTTNANGLVSIEIGGRKIFSLIDWADGPYFIKTEIDPTGGTSYTIEGTSQLLSVPYALHAETAERIAGSYTETQTIADVAAIGNSVNTQLKNITDPTDAQDAATKAYVDALYAESLKGIDLLRAQIEELQLASGLIVKDFEGNVYHTITIGTQVWMAENLKTTRYNDGTDIPLVTDMNAWRALSSPGYCWYNNEQTTYGNIYGALYNWFAAASTNPKNVCPEGWHVPSDNEWTTLSTYLGGGSVAGGKLKESGTTHWKSTDAGVTNELGFTALPGGHRNEFGYFGVIGEFGEWWSATNNGIWAWGQRILHYQNGLYRDGTIEKRSGYSIRCVKD